MLNTKEPTRRGDGGAYLFYYGKKHGYETVGGCDIKKNYSFSFSLLVGFYEFFVGASSFKQIDPKMKSSMSI